MKTIRRKISAGFLALSLVLFCAVIINIFEITRLENDTEEVIGWHHQLDGHEFE